MTAQLEQQILQQSFPQLTAAIQALTQDDLTLHNKTEAMKNVNGETVFREAIGIEKAIFLFANNTPLNRATAIIGEKFGSNGRNLDAIDNITNVAAIKNLISNLLFIFFYLLSFKTIYKNNNSFRLFKEINFYFSIYFCLSN
jgi:hypothetical protein